MSKKLPAVKSTGKPKPLTSGGSAPARVRDKNRTGQELWDAFNGLQAAGVRVSVVAVAEAVGVDPSLVHHVYPELAEAIANLRKGVEPDKAVRRENRLSRALEEISELRQQLMESERSIKTLISRNATLELRVRSLEAGRGESANKVLSLKSKSKSV